MSARLVLLTGPAAGEVASVLRLGTSLDPNDHAINAVDGHWWDEVRDYWERPRRIVDEVIRMQGAEDYYEPIEVYVSRMEEQIREGGGEAWLVGLVLPVGFSGLVNGWGSEYHRMKLGLPARLAILAPEPPPLLVERVKAWGGEVWDCNPDALGADGTEPHIEVEGGSCWSAPTWPDAVRAALGEVAPC